MSDADDNYGYTPPIGMATIRLCAKVTTDCWTDYAEKWAVEQKSMVDVHSPSHFGWCVGIDLAHLAKAILLDRTNNPTAALEGVADAFADAVDSFRDQIRAADVLLQRNHEEAKDGRRVDPN